MCAHKRNDHREAVRAEAVPVPHQRAAAAAALVQKLARSANHCNLRAAVSAGATASGAKGVLIAHQHTKGFVVSIKRQAAAEALHVDHRLLKLQLRSRGCACAVRQPHALRAAGGRAAGDCVAGFGDFAK